MHMADTLVERFRTWRARNPRGTFATTIDIRCEPTADVPSFTLTTRCDSHIIAALDGKSDPPCGVIRFRASAGYCNACDDECDAALDNILLDGWADGLSVSPFGRTVREAIIEDAATDPAYKAAYVAALQDDLDTVFTQDSLDPHDITSICFDAWADDGGASEILDCPNCHGNHTIDFCDAPDAEERAYYAREDDYDEERGY
jgi:hypothetical protein